MSQTVITPLTWKGDTINRVNKEGLKIGWHAMFYKNGSPSELDFYLDGKKNGGSKTYYKNGNVESNMTYLNDTLSGFYQLFHSMGAIKETGVLRKGMKVGQNLEYDYRGILRRRNSYNSSGHREGYQIFYHQNKIISLVEMLDDGVYIDFKIAFDTLGEPVSISQYKGYKVFNIRRTYKDSIVINEDESGALQGILDFVISQNELVIINKNNQDEKLKLQVDQAKKDILIGKEKITKYILYAGVGLLFLFLILIYKSLQSKKKDNFIITKQKELVELAHQEITDSIAYAKRIQSAILPPAKLVKEYLKESFILYKPKDVVAGDFYWMEHKENRVLFAAADCTGHGVPGAMVSVVCNNALNRSVREHGLITPGEILTKTREIVIQEFEKSEDDVKDGMDIALCSLEGNKLQYAGAHNPLWIIRNGTIIETKANKQPIGQFDNPEPYTTHNFDLEQGDSIYIFSDGYVDQFGGEKGKKFKARAFRELLLSIQDKSMEEQKTIIDEAFETWKGSLEQIDDVCVIGVRI
jgi:serine phosphatase RsbU (regulator of sigma subunit)